MMAALTPGFADPVHDAQRGFRAILAAMAAPGRIHTTPRVKPPPGCSPAAAAVLLTLTDADTAVWTDAGEAAAAWLRFHAGCAMAMEPREADFVHGRRPPPLALLAPGTDAAPHLGATLLVEVEALREGDGWRLTGPGIEHAARLAVVGPADGFLAQLAANHAGYPSGVDIILCAGDRIAALPRSTRVELN